MMKYLKYLGFFTVISLVILWLAGVFSHRERSEEVKREVRIVNGLKIGKVKKAEEVQIGYVGNIVADSVAEISTRIAGKVTSVKVKEGQMVRKGQVLLTIDAGDILAQTKAVNEQIKQAEEAYKSALSNYEAVKKTYERYSSLLKENAVTQQEFDQIKAQYETAKAQVEQARAGIRAFQFQKQAVMSNLGYTTLKAPFNGYVAYKKVDVGDLASPGAPLLVIEKPPYKLEVSLPEEYVGKIKVGDIYPVYVEAIDKIVQGKVSEVSPSLDPTTRTFRIKLQLSEGDLKSGMYAKLLLPEKLNVLLVPESAIFRRFDFTGVWVVKPDNTLELRFVKLGERRGNMVEVLSGLSADERIVTEGIERACDGCKIGG
ncbi:efflux RND transporter periplasmic adaptor subunit [Hydrogenobacter thermophilus]|uniref:efflux RND transporter periplasmic adaptor subunit n=1 Tax=Hydrogenobacter thermophilus TaxID=940 RepID=UPI0030FAEA12